MGRTIFNSWYKGELALKITHISSRRKEEKNRIKISCVVERHPRAALDRWTSLHVKNLCSSTASGLVFSMGCISSNFRFLFLVSCHVPEFRFPEVNCLSLSSLNPDTASRWNFITATCVSPGHEQGIADAPELTKRPNLSLICRSLPHNGLPVAWITGVRHHSQPEHSLYELQALIMK